nr:unnamed protein product [Callosobruchus analis]
MRATEPSSSKNWRDGANRKRRKTAWSTKQGGGRYSRITEYRPRKGTRDRRREYHTRKRQ